MLENAKDEYKVLSAESNVKVFIFKFEVFNIFYTTTKFSAQNRDNYRQNFTLIIIAVKTSS